MLTTLTYNIAEKISSGETFTLSSFIENAGCNHYTPFTHYNFFYSYPEFGKEWSNGKTCQFHMVNTKCNLCDFVPDRNFAGIGTLFLLHNGVSDKEILRMVPGTGTGKKASRIYVPNTPRLSQMILLCKDHVSSHFLWNTSVKKNTPQQLQLF